MTETVRCGRVALAGRPNAGKSSLLNALLDFPLAAVSPRAQTTRLPTVGLHTTGNVQFVFDDLPGILDPSYLLQHRMLDLAIEGIRLADVVVHLHPAPDAPAPALTDVAAISVPASKPLVLVYTKADLVAESIRAGLRPFGSVVSAKTGEGLADLLTTVGALLPEQPFLYPADDVGTQPVRFFVAEYLREAAFEFLEDELPYCVAVEIEEFREDRDPVYIRATLFVERRSQKGIVLGAGGRTIKAIGQHARARAETLLDRKVFLDTWVKVLPGWRRNAGQLARFGFGLPQP